MIRGMGSQETICTRLRICRAAGGSATTGVVAAHHARAMNSNSCLTMVHSELATRRSSLSLHVRPYDEQNGAVKLLILDFSATARIAESADSMRPWRNTVLLRPRADLVSRPFESILDILYRSPCAQYEPNEQGNR